MNSFVWSEDMRVRVISLDDQHKKIIELINSLVNAVSRDLAKEEILEILKSFKEYMVYHFSSEETLMKQTAFEDYYKHKAEHDMFIGYILSFEDRYQTGKLKLSSELTVYLEDWIKKHLTGTDQKYSQHFLDNGVI